MFDIVALLARIGLFQKYRPVGMRVSFGSFFADRRGDKLASYRVVRSKAGTYFLLLRGSEAAARQLENSAQCERRRVPLALAVEFTHCLRLESPPTGPLKTLLNLLVNVVTLPSAEELECALALDFYKDPKSHEDPMQWANTPAGELLHQAKYHGSVAAAKQLAQQLAEVIQQHPSYSAADAIISVPGHKKNEVSFGVRLAKRVSTYVNKPLLVTESRGGDRLPAKEIGKQDVDVLRGDFVVSKEVRDKTVIIVDDVYRSGTSMSAVAALARQAGAQSALGLAGVRTMRK